MQQKKIITVILFISALSFFTACKKNVTERMVDKNSVELSAGNMQGRLLTGADFQKLADTLAFRLRGKCTGYNFIVSYLGQYKTTRAGGQCRTMQNTPARAMTMYEKYSIASVSKTITAVALFKKMEGLTAGIATLDAPVWKYLPSHWVFGPNFKTITFRQLLNHTSGIRYDVGTIGNGSDYQTLKKLAAAGVYLSLKTYKYNNRNYDLMRLIIPKMGNYNIVQIPANTYPSIMASLESIQASQLANAYKDCCRQTIFNKLGTTATQTIDCVNTDLNPGICYTLGSTLPGYFTGFDRTLESGSQGWVLNTAQVNDFFTTLQYTNTLLSFSVSALMKSNDLGYDFHGFTTDGISWYWKNGVYNYNSPTLSAAYRSLIIGFGDDIQITIMANSAINLQDIAIAAHQDWHP